MKLYEKKKLKIVFIGRLEPWKGVDIFVKIINLIKKKEKKIEAIVVGDGSLYKRLSIENPKIKFTGKVNHKIIPEILAGTSILILPSYIEGVPTVCLEALAAEIPIVASDVGGISEVVINNKTGYTCPPGESEKFAEKAIKLITDKNLRDKMGKNGRNLIKKDYTWDKVIKKVENVYQKIV